MNDEWWRWVSKRRPRIGWNDYDEIARRFARGFCRGAKQNMGDWVLLPTGRTVAAVVTAASDPTAMVGVLDQLARLPLHEIIVVVDGAAHDTHSLAAAHPAKPIVVHSADPLAYAKARATGAEASACEIVLFTDGRMTVDAERYVRFVDALERGADVALNDVTPYVGRFRYRDPASVIDEFVNRAYGRRDLGACTLSAVPHALSRRAIETIGIPNFAVPALAQTIALQSGLTVAKADSVNASACMKRLSAYEETGGKRDDTITGDHLSAFHYAFARCGSRLQHPDGLRRREAIKGSGATS